MIRVCLIETWCPESFGSMRRYGDLIAAAFDGDSEVQIKRHRIGVAASELRRWPRVMGTPLRHAKIWWGVRRDLPEADLYHVTDGSLAYLVRRLPRRKAVVTIHDLIPYLQQLGRFPGVSPPSFFSRQIIRRNRAAVQRAALRLADSSATAADLYASGITDQALTRVVFPPLSADDWNRASLPIRANEQQQVEAHRFVLHVGNNAFYKNRLGVVEVFSRVRKSCDVRLVLAGPAPDQRIQQRIGELGLSDSVDVVINPSDEMVADLYRRAALLIFPSLYEGFGWPPLEAMASGCPVVCSNAGSLPEVVADAAICVELSDHEGMAAACCRVLQHREVAEQLVERGLRRCRDFSLDRFRLQLTDAYRFAVK